MKDDRLRVTLDERYAHRLGLATFCFARCEWDAVWCCERLQPGYINTIEAEKKTAGTIAKDLRKLVERISDVVLKNLCRGPAEEFDRLTKQRNALLHGKPATSASGAQRLFKAADEWTPEAIEDLADEFTACQILLNDMVHKHLVAL